MTDFDRYFGVMEPRILVLDIETLPNLDEALEVWPGLGTFPGLTLKATVSSILCIGYKWYGDTKTHCIKAWDFPGWKKNVNDDKALLKEFLKVVDGATAVCTHNGKRFDWKHIQTRLLYHKLDPLPKLPHIDTKQIASQHLYAFRNKLDYLGKTFLDDRKTDHEGWDLWVKSHRRDPKALKLMEKYCKQDVNLTERLFVKLRPFANAIPNYNLFKDHNKDACPSCGSTRLRSNGWRYTQTRTYKRLICLDCKSWARLDAKDKNPRGI